MVYAQAKDNIKVPNDVNVNIDTDSEEYKKLTESEKIWVNLS